MTQSIGAIIPTIIVIVGVLVALTNIITEVLKKVLPEKIHTNIIAVTVSLILTLLSFFGYMSYLGVAVMWYYILAAVVVGFMVAYAAMFGFDKLKQIITSVNK